MKNLSHNSKMRLVFIALLILMTFICSLFTGCEILKTRKINNSDSISVKKSDITKTDSIVTGQIKKDETKSKEDWEWFKITLQNLQNKDTNVTNIYPQTIVYEGGKGRREQETRSTDSSWKEDIMRFNAVMFDSLGKRLQSIETSKHSESKDFNIIILVGVWIGLQLLGYTFKNFSIIKKQSK